MAPRDSFNTTTTTEDDSTSNTTTLATTTTQDDDDKKKKKKEMMMMQPFLAKKVSNTFHWEMNLYCIVTIALLYWYMTPEIYRIYWHIMFGLLLLDATRYYYYRGNLAGVPYTIPFVNLIAMILNPERFWAEMGTIAMSSSNGLCTNTMVGTQMIFCTNPKLCRHIFTTENDFGIYAHPNAIWLFDPKNLIYIQGDVHKKVRAVLTPALFSEAALTQYAMAQEKVCRIALEYHAKECERTGKPFNAMVAFRTLGANSSQEAFLGPFLTTKLKDSFEKDILTFTMGFLSFPCPYIGGLRQAILAKSRIEATIFSLVPLARQHILDGYEPRCLLEHWCQAIIQTAKERQCEPTQVYGCTDDDIARCILDFLFAAQDATNSALVYSLDVLQAHTDVMEKCYEEIQKDCGLDGSVANPKHNQLIYVTKVANQILHYKPPVPMVPHLVRRTTTWDDGREIVKGTVVIPSITYSARVSGHALEFQPERLDCDTQFIQTVVFGAGQHKCPGRRYAESLLRVFISVLTQGYMIERCTPRPGPDDFIFYPTLFPKDSNFILKKRGTK